MTVAPGDQLWGIAEDEMASRLDRAPSATKIAPFWRDLIDANRSRLVDPNNPSLVHPGETIAIPGGIGELHTEPAADGGPDDTPATTEPDVPDDPAEGGPTELTPSVATEHADAPDDEDAGIVPAARAASPPDDVDEPRDVRPALAVGGLTSLALAVGVKRAVRMRRHRFMRQHPGQVNQGTPDADLPVHRAALLNGNDQPIDDLRSVLGCLAEDLAAANGTAQPRVVQHSLDHVDAFLAAPDLAPPDGWNPEADGAVWTLDPSLAPRSSRTCAAPLLVTLGQPDDDGQIYLDLEADGVISLVGDPDAARGLARSILTELSLGPLTDTVQIVVVGDLVDISASALEHVTLADTWDEALDKLEEWAEGSHAALVANGWPNTFVARGADEFHDALSPLVVIAAKAPPGEVAATIAAHRPSAVAIVVAHEVPDAATVIDCQPDLLTVIDLDLRCVPQDLDDDTFASIMRLLISAESPADPATAVDDGDEWDSPPEGEYDDTTVDEDTEGSSVFTEPDYEVLVRVLGHMSVEGVGPLTPKLTAAFTYIALHRSVTVEALEEACWSNLGGNARQRMRDAMSECRRIVGSQHLPQAQNGHYEVRPSVITDADLFEIRVARAAQLPPEQAVEMYRSALDLVTGKVFSYPSRASSACSWIDAENLVSQWEVKIAGVALQCAETYLDLGAPGEAVEAAQAALNALPLHTQLTECLMRSHAAAGDTRAVDTVYRAHVEALSQADNLEPDDSTIRLHHELMAAQKRNAS